MKWINKTQNFRIKLPKVELKMYMNGVQKKEDCKNVVLEDLRKLGIKSRPKKLKQHVPS